MPCISWAWVGCIYTQATGGCTTNSMAILLAAWHHCPLTSTKSHRFTIEAHV